MIGDRDFHHQQQANSDLHFSQLLGQKANLLQAIRPGQWGHLAIALDTGDDYQADKVWYWNYHLPEETRRGLGDTEDPMTNCPGTTGWARVDDPLTPQLASVALPDYLTSSQNPSSTSGDNFCKRVISCVYPRVNCGPVMLVIPGSMIGDAIHDCVARISANNAAL